MRSLVQIVILALSIFAPWQMALASSFDDGVKLFNARKYAQALSQFESSVRTKDRPESALYYQALCYHYQSQFEKASSKYKEVFTRFPSTAAAASARAAYNQLSGAAGEKERSVSSVEPSAPVAATAARAAVGRVVSPESDWYMGITERVGEIPFAYSGRRMIVVATINGKPTPAIFDTGANVTLFGKVALEKAGIDTRAARKAGRIYGVAGEAELQAMTCNVRLGTISTTLQIGIEDDTAEARNGRGMKEGLIGADIFADYVFEVDPSAQVIRFLKKVEKRGGERNAQTARLGEPFRWEGESIVVTPKINGRECPMIFDTGCTGFSFSDKQLGSAGLVRPVDSAQGRSTGIGGSRESYMFNIDTVTLGPAVRKNISATCSVYGTHDYPLLGMSFLSGLRFIVDPGKQIIRFAGP